MHDEFDPHAADDQMWRLKKLVAAKGGQVEALLRDFLREGALRSFEILRVESDPRRYALVQARARAIDRGLAARGTLLFSAVHERLRAADVAGWIP